MAEPTSFRPQYYTVEADQTYGFHPAAEAYPRTDEETLAAICDDMRENGFDTRYPIALLKGQIIDGITRYTAAKRTKTAFVVCHVPEGTDPDRYVQRANENRRQLTDEWIEEKRQQRIHKAVELRREGKSERSIAKELGVSQPQVHKDLQGNGDNRLSPETPDGKVIGSDGVAQPATKAKKPPVLCSKCSRLPTPVEGCNFCKAARKTAKEKEAAKKKSGKSIPSEIADAFGNTIPKSLLDAWRDPFIGDAFDLLTVTEENIRKARLADKMAKKGKHYPFLDSKEFIDATGFVLSYLDQMIAHVKDNRPAAVCPICEGKKCADCKHSGLVPRKLYGELKKKAKESAK